MYKRLIHDGIAAANTHGPIDLDFGKTCDQIDRADMVLPRLRGRVRQADRRLRLRRRPRGPRPRRRAVQREAAGNSSGRYNRQAVATRETRVAARPEQ